jgi:pimeloyl-ACP methyl ester carboxylesterase
MSEHAHVTAPTRYVEAGGIRCAYRRFGLAEGTPVLFFQHFRGGMDHWDPAVTDGLATTRPVILFDNAGVAASGGETPATVERQADDAAGFLAALGVPRVDALGFSLGGFVAQAFTLRHPDLVRKLVLVGTMPRGGTDEGAAPDYAEVATRHEVPTLEDFLYLFFDPAERGQAAGRAFWERRHRRVVDVDPATTAQTLKAQVAAGIDWREPHGERFADLARITQPTLVVNGDHDIMVPTENSHLLAREIPNAELVIYPESGHGSLFQYPELFVARATEFLDA